MTARHALVIAAAVLLVSAVVRNAAVAIMAPSAPRTAARIWPGQPTAEVALPMTQSAQAARAGREVPSAVFTRLQLAARRDPLAPEPFLVRGVQAQLAGDTLVAQRAFQAAQWRDPRSLPAAYFLADRYVRAGDLDRGLRQIAALARLSPGGARAAGPYLAAFAASRRNWPALRRVFRTNPQLAEPALVALAGDLATIPAVLALADVRTSGPQAAWLAPLLETLVEAGQYDRARSIWAQASRATLGALLHDAGFRCIHWRAMMRRCISLVPSPMHVSGASR